MEDIDNECWVCGGGLRYGEKHRDCDPSVELPKLRAQLSEMERQRDKFYGEANIERQASQAYQLVLDQLVDLLGEIPYGDIVGTVMERQRKLEAAEKDAASKQSEIDRLMLEYCPGEMTPEQVENWAKAQVVFQALAQNGKE